MGMKQQIYIAFRPGCIDDKTPKPQIVVGAHIQWLYGATSVKQAGRMMQFVTKISSVGEYDHRHPFYNKEIALKTLENIYTTIPEEGYMTNIHLFEGEQDNGEKNDPRLGDNDEGIVVFDFRDIKNPTYCFMVLPNSSSQNLEGMPEGEPLSAEQYLGAYYSLKKSNPLKQYELYQLREAKTKRAKKKAEKEIKDMRIEHRAVLAPFKKFKVMTGATLMEIFPAAYALGQIESQNFKMVN